MTKEQFLALAAQLYDAQTGGSGSGDGRAPKHDTSLPAGAGQVIYASECSLKELQYQKGRADKPPSDPKYAESNAKRSKALAYFVAYRQANPTECWVGERNRVRVTAAPPSDRPEKYDREAMPGTLADAPPSPPPGDDLGDIPF